MQEQGERCPLLKRKLGILRMRADHGETTWQSLEYDTCNDGWLLPVDADGRPRRSPKCAIPEFTTPSCKIRPFIHLSEIVSQEFTPALVASDKTNDFEEVEDINAYIFRLSGRSVEELIKDGLKIRPDVSDDIIDSIKDQRSDRSRVAITQCPLIPRSGNKTFPEQLSMLSTYVQTLKRTTSLDIEDGSAGTVVDWLDIGLQLFERIGHYPFGREFGHGYTRAARYTSTDNYFIIGGSSYRGINIKEFGLDSKNSSVGLAPLLYLAD